MSRVSGFSSEYLAEDIEYLHRISTLQSIHGDFTLEMAIRGKYVHSLSLWKEIIASREGWYEHWPMHSCFNWIPLMQFLNLQFFSTAVAK